MTMWVGIYTRVSPFTLANILYHRSSWMSSVCDKLFERKTGTPTSSGPRLPTHRRYNYGHQGYRHPWWHLYHITGSSFCQVFLQKFLKKFLGIWEKMIAAASCVCAYIRVCMRVRTCAPTDTHRHMCTGTHRHMSSGTLLTRSQKVVEGRGPRGRDDGRLDSEWHPFFDRHFDPQFWPWKSTVPGDGLREERSDERRRTKWA